MSRSWAKGQRMDPHQPASPLRATARHLALVARRFMNDRANLDDVDRAVRMWQEVSTAERGKK